MKYNSSIQSVDRALLILQFLLENKVELGVTDISNRLDVAKSTTHRLLTSLQKQGYVQQDKQTDRYKLGLKLIELGNAVTDSLDVRKISRPYLQKLCEEIGETTHLVLLEQGEVVYIDKIESSATIRMNSRVGKRAPAYCTGVGKAILSYLPMKETEQIICDSDLKSYTENTIVNMEALMDEFSSIRKTGYSVDNEEHEEGIRCVGSVIIGHQHQVIAGISIAGPSMRMTNEKLESCTKKIVACATEISANLGYNV